MTIEERPNLAAVEDAKRYVEENAAAVNGVLKEFWNEKREEWKRFGPTVAGAAEAYDRLTSDGKKIRAGLVKLGYDACRTKESPVSSREDGIYWAAASVEVLHNAFLIHDDIVDNSNLRRGTPTVHCRYADGAAARFASPEAALAYGRAVALNFGDKGQALAQEFLLSSGFPDDVILRAVALLSQVTVETVTGQLLDVDDVKLSELTEEQVFLIHEYKTAHYTVMLPLLMGAILAGAARDRLARIRAFSIPLGIAFQIHDDILGLFGDQEILGKPVDSDLREGKKTLLFVHSYEAAGQEDRAFLERVHGNSETGPADLKRVREIVRTSGALGRSEEIALGHVQTAKPHVEAIAASPEWGRILAGLADYFVLRRF